MAAIITVEQANEIVKKLNRGSSINSLAREYGVSKRTITKIKDLGVDPGGLEAWIKRQAEKRAELTEDQKRRMLESKIEEPLIINELREFTFSDRKSFSLGCQVFTTEMLSTLVVMVRDKYTPPKVKADIIKYLLDQGWGKAPVVMEDPGEEEDKFDSLIEAIEDSVRIMESEEGEQA